MCFCPFGPPELVWMIPRRKEYNRPPISIKLSFTMHTFPFVSLCMGTFNFFNSVLVPSRNALKFYGYVRRCLFYHIDNVPFLLLMKGDCVRSAHVIFGRRFMLHTEKLYVMATVVKLMVSRIDLIKVLLQYGWAKQFERTTINFWGISDIFVNNL